MQGQILGLPCWELVPSQISMRSRRCLFCDVLFLKANGNRQVPKWPPVNSVVNYLSTGAGLQLLTVSFTMPMTLSNENKCV